MTTNNYNDWADSNLFCYALRMAEPGVNEVYATMKTDLDNHFHFTARKEKRTLKAFVLKRIGNTDKLATKGSSLKRIIRHNGENETMVFQNIDYAVFINMLNNHYLGHGYLEENFAFRDSTGFLNGKKVDIMIPWNEIPEDVPLADMRKALNQYGLDLVEELTEPMEVLVLRKDDYKSSQK
jgi:hypothetical protein